MEMCSENISDEERRNKQVKEQLTKQWRASFLGWAAASREFDLVGGGRAEKLRLEGWL